MNVRSRTRTHSRSQLTLLWALLCVCALPASALKHPQQTAPIERRSPPAQTLPSTGGYPASPQLGPQDSRANNRGVHGEHLAEWISKHSNLTPQQQQHALQHEPGFRELPVDTQQRMLNRLAQLDAMMPEQRQRLLARNEAMERLTPNQRSDVRGALGQLGSLPLEQRRVVAHTFRALRDIPADQRYAALNSGRFGPPLNDVQRNVLMNLLRVEPMLPPPTASGQQPPQTQPQQQPQQPVQPYPMR